jgi:hypothetical protein
MPAAAQLAVQFELNAWGMEFETTLGASRASH